MALATVNIDKFIKVTSASSYVYQRSLSAHRLTFMNSVAVSGTYYFDGA